MSISMYPTVVLVALLATAGCADSIVFVTATTTGIELSAVEGGKQSAKIGYERAEGVIMPMRKSDDTLRPEAYSVLAAYDMRASGLTLANLGSVRIAQVFATGAAAERPLSRAQVQATFLNAIALGQEGAGPRLATGAITPDEKRFSERLRAAEGLLKDLDKRPPPGPQDAAAAFARALGKDTRKAADDEWAELSKSPTAGNLERVEKVISELNKAAAKHGVAPR